MDIICESLWIAAVIIGFLSYAGLGMTFLLAYEPIRGHAILIVPWVGYAVTVAIASWCGWLGGSAGQAMMLVFVIATPCNLFGLLRYRKAIPLREHLTIFGLTGVTLAIALYPLWYVGILGPLGANGDAVLYANVAAYLETHQFPGFQPEAWTAAVGWQPAKLQLALARDYGLPYGFSYVHAIIDRLTAREAHETFAIVTAVALALAVPVYAFMARCLFGAEVWASRLTAFLAAISPTLVWVHYNGYAMHGVGLGLLPLAFGTSVLAWQQGLRARLLAALSLSAAFVTYSPGALMFVLAPLMVYGLFRCLCDRARWFMYVYPLGLLLILAALANLPGILHAGTFAWHLADLRFAMQFGDVENYVAWRELYGLAHSRLRGAMAPQEGLSALSIGVGVGAVVITLVGLWRSTGVGRLAFGALGLVYITILFWLRYVLGYPYGYMKTLTFATFPALIAISSGWDYLVRHPRTSTGKGVAAISVLTVVLLAAMNLVHLTTMARWIAQVTVDFPALLALRQLKEVIPPGAAIHIRDAKDTPLLWMTYFLKDYSLSIAHYTPYYLRWDWPFYRQAISTDWVIVDAEARPAVPWAGEVAYANRRYRLLRKASPVLFHLDVLDEARAIRPGGKTTIQGYHDELVVDGQAFDLPHQLQAGQQLRMGVWVPAGSRLRCESKGQVQVIEPHTDLVVLEWPLPETPWQISLENEGPRSLWLPGWIEVVQQAGQTSQRASVPDILAWHQEEVLPKSGVFRVSGWYPLEDGRQRWMTGVSASVLKNPGKPLALVLEGVTPHQRPASSPSTITITLNDQVVGKMTAGVDPFRATFLVSEEILGVSQWAVLEMQVDAVFVPKQQGVSDDPRPLGLMVTRLEWLDLELAGEGMIDFGTANARRYLAEGWSIDEQADGITYVWADAPESLVWVAIPHPTDLEVMLRVLPIRLPAQVPQELRISINGVEQQHLTLAPEAWQVLAFTVPREVLRAGLNRLRFAYRQTVSPTAVMPTNRDSRTLAVAFDYLHVRPLLAGGEKE